MRVLGLCSYPVEAAATRFRMSQFVGPLAERGIELDIRPFLDSERFLKLYSHGGIHGSFSLLKPLLNRFLELTQAGSHDLIFVQREAMIFGPALFEWLHQKLGRVPMVLDLDDATYVRYISPRFGRLGSLFKFFGKTDKLIDRSSAVTCGNRMIAEYARSRGARAVVVPTVVDAEVFRPVAKKNPVPVIGWIGTHSTFPFLEKLFPVLERLAQEDEFVLRIVGASRDTISISGVTVEHLDWDREREVADFQSLDIGLYPIFPSPSASKEWLNGKSGFKAIEYMAAGIPFVMSPVGICAEIGEVGLTHFIAEEPDDWCQPLKELLSSPELRQKMGVEGRRHSIQYFRIEEAVDTLAELFRDIVSE